MPPPLQLFIAYSRKDSAFLDELRVQLTPLERSGKAKIWYDGKIEPGVVWETAIRENLHSADIILRLVSADAIASDYFYDKELADALARHAAGTARVVPLIVRPCVWQETRLGELQALPKDGKAVTSWSDRDEAYADAVAALTRMVNNILVQRGAEAKKEEQELQFRYQAEQKQEHLKKTEEEQRLAAVEATHRRQQETTERQQKAEAERQRKEAAAKQRRQKLAGSAVWMRSPKVWGSALVGIAALLVGNWICNLPPAAKLPQTQQSKDTSSLIKNTPVTVDTQAGATIISPGQPKEKGNEAAAKGPPKETKPSTAFSDPFTNDMVRIKVGSFMMGCDPARDGECKWDSEKPLHEVTVQSFFISSYEVTQTQWRAVMGSDPPELRFKGCDDCPVENVSWNDAQKFIKTLNKLSGKIYRLPSEAEWEFAARGGNVSRNTTYAGSDDRTEAGWSSHNSGRKTHSIGKKKKNELGLYDMSGNVWEWCQDTWHKDYEGAPKDGSAWTTSGDQSIRVVRGGSWSDVTFVCRVADRSRYFTGYRFSDIGFRLAR